MRPRSPVIAGRKLPARSPIPGLDPSRDTIKLASTPAGSFAAVQSETSSSAGGALIALDANRSILLGGLGPASLGPANFLFA